MLKHAVRYFSLSVFIFPFSPHSHSLSHHQCLALYLLPSLSTTLSLSASVNGVMSHWMNPSWWTN